MPNDLPYFREPLGSRLARRLVTIPALVFITGLYLTVLPLLLLGAALRDAAGAHEWQGVRCLLAIGINLSWHLVGLAVYLGASLGSLILPGAHRPRITRWNSIVQTWWTTAILQMFLHLYDMDVRVEGQDILDGRGPLIVLMRHASIIDILLPFALLGTRGYDLRFIMKRELLLDPVVDVYGHRAPAAFVERGGLDSEAQRQAVRRLAQALRPRDAIILYPEGTRFTPDKQQRVLRKLARSAPDHYRRAAALRNLLPPRFGGALTLLDAADEADVVFLAHTGLEGANHVRNFLDGTVLHGTLRIALWSVHGCEVPPDDEERKAWLYDAWRRMDRWIDANRSPAPATQETGLVSDRPATAG